VHGGKGVSEKLVVIWFAIVLSILKVRNTMIFKMEGFKSLVIKFVGLLGVDGIT
jgi:hypothetical protein